MPTEWRIEPGPADIPVKLRQAEAQVAARGAARAQQIAEAEDRSRRAQVEVARELARQAANPKGLEPFRLQVECKKEVLARLLSPGTAQFPEGLRVDGSRFVRRSMRRMLWLL